MILHAGLVARRACGRWRGALIEGPSGAGKSDLALRAWPRGFRLVADDRSARFRRRRPASSAARPTPLRRPDRGARASASFAGARLPLAEIALVVRCAAAPD